MDDELKAQDVKDNAPKTRLSQIHIAADGYGLRSFDNYAQIRSVAERLRDGLCEYLDNGQKCVFLVPPQGPFGAQDYGSAAYSVSGKGVLPLEPISFGLAIKISSLGDYMRLVLLCRKEGDRIYLTVDEFTQFEFDMPFTEDDLARAYEGLFKHLLKWFESRTERYDNGNYGSSDIGFDILRAAAE